MRNLNLIFLIMLIFSCKSSSLPANQNKTLESVVAETLGEGAVIQKNKDATFALCTKENLSTRSVSYLIVRLSDLVIVEKDNVSRASFTWIDNYKIEVKTIPGIVKKDEQSVPRKVIDVTKYMVKL